MEDIVRTEQKTRQNRITYKHQDIFRAVFLLEIFCFIIIIVTKMIAWKDTKLQNTFWFVYGYDHKDTWFSSLPL